MSGSVYGDFHCLIPVCSCFPLCTTWCYRSKLRELFPVASFSGGISLSDQGLDLLNKLLNIDPKQVRRNRLLCSLNSG